MAQPPVLPAPYRAERALGEGATGYVWLARDTRLDLSVAVKIVRPNLAKYARFRARFAREVTLSTQVLHPHLVPVYDFGSLSDGRPYVVMGYADQGSLGQLLRWGPPLREVLRIMDQVLAALEMLHAAGLVHQDLKPANILLHSGALGEVSAWVSDLGVAGTFSELAMDRRGISGTPTWMAPEQLSRRPQELGPWTDLYALGLMLHEMLGGERGAEETPPGELLRLRLAGPPPLLEDVPPAVAQIVQRLLDPDPRQRYDRAADVRRALRDAMQRFQSGDRAAKGSHGGVGGGTTTFLVPMLPEALAEVVVPHHDTTPSGAAPRWNRVAPDPLPAEPPEPHREDPPRSGLRLFALREPPLVGRDAQRRFLWQKAREVVRSQVPRVVLVVGPSGSGKSSLVDSVAQALEQGGYMEAVRLRYHQPAGPDDGYRGAVRELLAPWHDTREQMEKRLQRWLGRDQQVTPELVAREAAVLARWCGYQHEDEAPVNAAVGLTFLYRHLDARAWRGAAALVLEDAHLARAEGDGLSICDALLDHSVGQRPVLAMVTLASEALEKDAALARKIASLEARGALRVSVDRMTTAELREMMVQGLCMDPTLAAAAAPLCQGSPANATLLLRDWAARGHLVQDAAMRSVLRPGIALEAILPTSLEELFERRIEGGVALAANPPAASEALAAAALAGQEAPVSLIRAINPEGLDSLFAAGLLQQQGWQLRFESGGVMRAASRLALRRPDLTSLHGRLADAWAEVGEKTGLNVDFQLGQHRLLAGSPQEALTPLLRAARLAREEGRAALALDAAQMATDAADRIGTLTGQIEARQQAGGALLELDRPQEALDTLALVARLGRPDRRSLARLRVLEARAVIALGRLEEGRQRLEQASLDFSATQDRQGLMETLHGQGMLYRMAGQPRPAVACFKRMLQLNQHTRDLRIEVRGLTGLIEARLAAGQLRSVDMLTDRLRRVARHSGDTRNIAQSTFTAGLVHLRLRRLDEAERYFSTARALAATLGSDRLQLACLNHLGEVHRHRADITSAERSYQRAVRFAEERVWGSMAAVARLNLALLYLETSPRLARAQVDQAAALLRQHPQHWAWLTVGLLRAQWNAEAGDPLNCQAWWAVAIERGLGRLRDPNLVRPLLRLRLAAQAHGWIEIVQRADKILQRFQLHEEAALPAEE